MFEQRRIRQRKRTPVRVVIRIQFASMVIEARTSNMTEEGIGVEISDRMFSEFSIGETLGEAIRICLGEEKTEARVVRLVPGKRRDQYFLGIRFVDPDEKFSRVVRLILAKFSNEILEAESLV